MFVDGDIVDAPGDFQLAFAGFGHARFVNRQDDDRGIMFFGEFENFVGFFAPRFKMGRVDETAPRRGFERDFQHVQLGGVDDQRQVNARRDQFADDLLHQAGFVAALGNGNGDVEAVRAVVHLVAGNAQDGIPVFGQQKAFEGAAALGVAAFANQEGGGVLLHGKGFDAGSQFWDIGVWARGVLRVT